MAELVWTPSQLERALRQLEDEALSGRKRSGERVVPLRELMRAYQTALQKDVSFGAGDGRQTVEADRAGDRKETRREEGADNWPPAW